MIDRQFDSHGPWFLGVTLPALGLQIKPPGRRIWSILPLEMLSLLGAAQFLVVVYWGTHVYYVYYMFLTGVS